MAFAAEGRIGPRACLHHALLAGVERKALNRKVAGLPHYR